MCEDCREEWGDEIYNGVHAFTSEWPDSEFGPAHIVLSDFNCEIGHIRWCLGLIVGELQRRSLSATCQHPQEVEGLKDLQRGALGNEPDFYADCDTDELRATETFLREWLLPRVVRLE